MRRNSTGFWIWVGRRKWRRLVCHRKALRVLMLLQRRSQCLSHDCTMYHSFALALAVTMTSAIAPSLLKQQIKFFLLSHFVPPASCAFALLTCFCSLIHDPLFCPM